MRRIKWMADEKDRADWDKWSALIAKLHNCHFKVPIKPKDMNPYTIRTKSKSNFGAAVAAVHAALKRQE